MEKIQVQKCVWCGIEPCDYYRAAEVEKRIAELESELYRLREIVDLDKFKEKALAKAAAGICEGCCEEHRGKTHAVRVWGKGDYDWGWFSYCEVACMEDAENRGMRLEYANADDGSESPCP